MKGWVFWVILAIFAMAYWVYAQSEVRANKENMTWEEGMDYSKLTEDQWKKRLDPQEFYILREKGTERAFTGEYWDHKDEGVYHCRGCGLELFHSDHKYDSGSGWPSYFQSVEQTQIATKTDTTHGMTRVEILCPRCSGHLGHVFPDGPQPTGQRYCVNSKSLVFKAKP